MDMKSKISGLINLEIKEERERDETDVNIKIDIVHNEIFPIDFQQVDIKDKIKSDTEDLVSHEKTYIQYDTSFPHNSTLTRNIHTDEIAYKCLEYNTYSKEMAGLIDDKSISRSDESDKCLAFDSNISSIKLTMFDEITNVEINEEPTHDETDVDIKTDIFHNELLPNTSQQLEIKHESKIVSVNIQNILTGDKPYKCLECDSSFRRKGNLNRHKLLHSEEKPYKCLECDSSFRQKGYLNTHKLLHSEEKPYKCLECDSSFIHKCNLNTHKLTHTKEKPYKCLECDSRFSHKSNLKRHKLTHTKEKPYKCLECDSRFTGTTNLNKHKLIHTGEKPFKCLECDSSFRGINNLKQHSRVHTGKKPYKCLQCDISFSQKGHLNTHKLIHSGEKPYICLHCNAGFRQKSTLKQHNLIHTGEKPYKCLECDSSFRDKSNLSKHNLIHSGISIKQNEQQFINA